MAEAQTEQQTEQQSDKPQLQFLGNNRARDLKTNKVYITDASGEPIRLDPSQSVDTEPQQDPAKQYQFPKLIDLPKIGTDIIKMFSKDPQLAQQIASVMRSAENILVPHNVAELGAMLLAGPGGKAIMEVAPALQVGGKMLPMIQRALATGGSAAAGAAIGSLADETPPDTSKLQQAGGAALSSGISYALASPAIDVATKILAPRAITTFKKFVNQIKDFAGVPHVKIPDGEALSSVMTESGPLHKAVIDANEAVKKETANKLQAAGRSELPIDYVKNVIPDQFVPDTVRARETARKAWEAESIVTADKYTKLAQQQKALTQQYKALLKSGTTKDLADKEVGRDLKLVKKALKDTHTTLLDLKAKEPPVEHITLDDVHEILTNLNDKGYNPQTDQLAGGVAGKEARRMQGQLRDDVYRYLYDTLGDKEADTWRNARNAVHGVKTMIRMGKTAYPFEGKHIDISQMQEQWLPKEYYDDFVTSFGEQPAKDLQRTLWQGTDPTKGSNVQGGGSVSGGAGLAGKAHWFLHFNTPYTPRKIKPMPAHRAAAGKILDGILRQISAGTLGTTTDEDE